MLTFHVPFIIALPSLFALHGVLERNPRTPAGTICDEFRLSSSDAKLYRTLDKVLSDSEIELVLIGTPNDTHYALVKASLEAGKHVLMDKPVTPSVQEAKELGELAKERKKVVCIPESEMGSRLFSVEEIVGLTGKRSKELGFDRYCIGLKGTWKDEPRPAAGPIFDPGVHLTDQTLCLFGRPTKITAFASNLGVGHPNVDDNVNFTIHMHYPARSALPYSFTAILHAHPLSVRSPQI
ncbi:hypothetical protein J3R30DRAFT_3716892 [Lentinula aciculospora]|uniref:Gfo/Idh/MocA-like oxidoreductase N-terminal domain-containing protein n=1 Tax=Lentinula aciculospora TaxID=153920 RepID=A0A9W8ZUT6_9AGAR|nr:hypothetical protein J3R30DRAFT_3716892 [Lentinula aciculospora]